MNKEFFRFLIVGGLNTGITYGIYLVLLLGFPYVLAYSGSYIIGVFISYYLNSKIVFQTNFSIKKMLQFPLVYVVQYVINTMFLYFLVQMNISEKLAPILVVILSIPITFILSKYILKKS
ncbi:Putative flippase GtrA (transmembrane translocase of bactoprenol-linked glucose) [Aneurinibacillus thermoaerophilus]|uniref:Putative flippase GtrA (Transmembrane translocase of bactoprenol-linked glucose) n=1 Tax=Aneurinibacillus thermoaerophilus TaxID=143495 RepID=Q6T1W4_ANETH|nr:putative integral membrane GtrA-like protein [Aneurinibacillus thermoaerophilus]SDH58680.1 Putative flippase GtrA (transmembrane translocase of bactoprenol-linked glucose) [Aneurinibacillus thermoaerophilus]